MDTDSAFTMAQRAANKIAAPQYTLIQIVLCSIRFFQPPARLAQTRTVRRLGHRKIAATRAAEYWAAISQLNAIFGWAGSAVAMHYTQAARWWRDEQAGAALLDQIRHDSPHPSI
jgi:hypothetical protein